MVKVNSFDLRKAFRYKAGTFAAIGFDVENPAIVYDFAAFRYINEFKYVSLFEHV